MDKKEDKRKGKGKYWYFITIYDCVICFGGEEYRERRYTQKPEKWEDRHKIVEFCHDQHFM